MVNVSNAIIEWLNTYIDDSINTDNIGCDSISIGLFKTPTQSVKKDILGGTTFDDYYTFMIRMDNLTDDIMVNNQDYLQTLEDWIAEQNDAHNYPDMDDYIVNDISVSTPFYIFSQEERTSIYQFTIHINFYKKGE